MLKLCIASKKINIQAENESHVTTPQCDVNCEYLYKTGFFAPYIRIPRPLPPGRPDSLLFLPYVFALIQLSSNTQHISADMEFTTKSHKKDEPIKKTSFNHWF